MPLSPAAIQVRDACRRYVTAWESPGLADPVHRAQIFKEYGKRNMLEIIAHGRRIRANAGKPYGTPVRVLKELLGDCEQAIAELVRTGEAFLIGLRFETPPLPGRSQYVVISEDGPKPKRRSVAVF